ncbi:MAG: pyrroline-5-carboxylate reductase [Spirochaetaceae bacterium]|jgi:pyrroline-5-carboxylate reductase|nr:pyrroline-5-carboxylate reductase [Spirochaetaceae bacterium]
MRISIACIGSGNMGTALMKGAAGIDGTEIGFTDTDRAKAEAAAKALGGFTFATNAEAAERGDFLFLAVKPQILGGVLEEIAPVLVERLASGNPAILVSMAPGWSIGKIQAAAGRPVTGRSGCPGVDSAPESAVPLPQAIVRIMPNTPALISLGVIALAASPEVPAERLDALEGLLGRAGIVDRIEERYMDAVTGLSGSGPAFVYLFIEALADGGVRAGLPRDKALRYAAQTVLGAAAMVRETGRHPGELKDMVTSPGGTTIAGVAALESGAFRGTVMNAVEAAFRRSVELG